MELQPVRKVNLSEGILSELRRLLFEGAFRPGEKLPTERELANLFGTNRNTLREALSVLQREGFIEARQGAGYFVKDFINDGTLNLIVPMIRDGWSFPLSLKVLREMLNFRRNFFLTVIKEMGCKIPESSKRKVQELWGEIEEKANFPREVFERDILIFREIIKASGNTFYLWVFNTVKELGIMLWEAGGRFSGWRYPDFYFETMKKFVDSLDSKVPEAILSALDEHFTRIDDFTLNYAEKILGGFE